MMRATPSPWTAPANAYVTGFTSSTEASFPVLGGPYLTHSGYYDAFVAKVTRRHRAGLLRLYRRQRV